MKVAARIKFRAEADLCEARASRVRWGELVSRSLSPKSCEIELWVLPGVGQDKIWGAGKLFIENLLVRIHGARGAHEERGCAHPIPRRA